ncbi:hypothetical protein [Pseudomonas sp. B15(2017)]|uniref:hypothetical protein n=1 Tax=Pseudomonas sp. B15(2017) TaxID=1981744 RepID=UPI000A1FB326|nr:hypothetical protein [Pseudomonas sp. B15(2017)]
MKLLAEKPENVLLRLRKQDTPTGVSSGTVELLTLVTGMSKTEMIHVALREYADRVLPTYDLDDENLTEAHISAIRAASPVSNLPKERRSRGIF